MTQEALKLALEAFEIAAEGGGVNFYAYAQELRKAIAELESQKPVELPCCGYTDASAIKWNSFNGVVQCHNCGQTYTPPQRTWVGLTDEDLKLLSAEWRIVYGAWMDDFARDIEAKLKEKNT